MHTGVSAIFFQDWLPLSDRIWCFATRQQPGLPLPYSFHRLAIHRTRKKKVDAWVVWFPIFCISCWTQASILTKRNQSTRTPISRSRVERTKKHEVNKGTVPLYWNTFEREEAKKSLSRWYHYQYTFLLRSMSHDATQHEENFNADMNFSFFSTIHIIFRQNRHMAQLT